MQKMFKKNRDIMLYKERTEFEELGSAKPQFQQCRICGSIYYKKSWHHQDDRRIKNAKKLDKLWVTRCPACKMVENKQYEGEVIIENIPKRFQKELFLMIKSYLKSAQQKDCQHRLISLTKDSANSWTIALTENQLANKLAQKIKSAFDKVDVKVSYSKEPDDLERIKVIFRPFLSLIPA